MATIEKIEQKRSAAESAWEAIQLTAANAQRELDYAIAVFEQHENELREDEINSTRAKIEEQREAIRTYLLKGHQKYQEDMLMYKSNLARLEKNASLHL